MEVLSEAIKRFLSIDYGLGWGDGEGSGAGWRSGSGAGWGWGWGTGERLGYGTGWGDGEGSGKCAGWGWGWGTGSGYGTGSVLGSVEGSGSGEGLGECLISFNGHKVYIIDGMPTVIEQVRGNLAKGFTINNDLTTERCCIVKGNNLFAHGVTAKEAEAALQEKIFDNMDVEEKIDAFLEKFDLDTKYPAKDFYEWHHKLTGSCEFGRIQFIKNHGIDIENGMYTVKEFIEITKNDFGGEIIERLEKRIVL